MNGIASSHGDGPDEVVEPLARFYEATRAKYVRMARCWYRRLHINEIGLASEGAVNRTWARLLERRRDGKIHPIPTLAEFEKTFAHLLWCVCVDERRRQKSGKRDGETLPLDAAFDVVNPLAVRPDAHAIAEEEYARLLILLARDDATLRVIAIRKTQGFRNDEIAAELDVSISTVERMLRKIRSILELHGCSDE